MDAGEPEVCEHRWLLVRAVLDGRGAWREYECADCPATAVQPASGDLRDG
ncbi:hypothetical protein [Geodermatophilus chilensis]|nr:hypothetical protein [Geodermatophilus chilensis]